MEDRSVSDAELAGRARAGEVEALAVLLERYRPSLYAVAIGLLRNRDDALDAVQETCLIAVVKLGSLRDPAAVGGWLHRVVRNACLLRLRHGGRESSSADVDVRCSGTRPKRGSISSRCAIGCGARSTRSQPMIASR